MTKFSQWKAWILPLVLFGGISVIVYLTAVRLPAFLESDQKMVGAVVYSRIMPENYLKDYAINNPDFFGSYYPFYIQILVGLTQRLGRFEYTLSYLITVTCFIYLTGMALLINKFTGQRWLSVALSIISAYPGMIGPLRDIWGPFMNIRGMRPGNMYLAFSTILLIPLFDCLIREDNKNRASLFFWGVLGMAFGLLTNIHQVSALGIIPIVSGLIFLAVLRKEVNIWGLVTFIITVFIGAIPAVLPYLQHAEGVQANELHFRFEEFYNIAQGLAHMVFPSRLWYIAKWVRAFGLDHVMPFNWPLQRNLIAAYSFLTLALLVLLLFLNRQARSQLYKFVYVLLVIIQLVMAVFFTFRYHWVSVLVVVYIVNRLIIEKNADSIDKRLIETLMIVLSFYPLAFIMQWLWRTFEVWQLTTWATQLTRELRFIYLPAILLIGRLLTLWAKRKDYSMIILASALFFLEIHLQKDLAALFFCWSILLLWSFYPKSHKRPWWLRELIMVLVVFFFCRYFIRVEISISAIVGMVLYFSWKTIHVAENNQLISINPLINNYLVSLGLLVFTITLFKDLGISLISKTLFIAGIIAFICPLFLYITRKIQWFQLNRRSVIILLWVVAGGLFMNVFGRFFYYQLQESHKMLGIFIDSVKKADNSPYLQESQLIDQELYQWVINETPEDSLFFCSNASFRFYAQRSITHSSKDLGQAMFARYLLVDYYQRNQRFESAFSNKEDLLAAVNSSGADYIITNKAQQKEMRLYLEELPWIPVFINSQFVVYKITE